MNKIKEFLGGIDSDFARDELARLLLAQSGFYGPVQQASVDFLERLGNRLILLDPTIAE